MHDNISDRWDQANIHGVRRTYGGYVRERVDVEILQPKKVLLPQHQQAFHPTNSPIVIRAIFEMFAKGEFQRLRFPGTLSKQIL